MNHNGVYYHPCRKCGAIHGMGIEDMATGKIEPIDLCKNCLFENSLPKPLTDPNFLENWHKEIYNEVDKQ